MEITAIEAKIKEYQKSGCKIFASSSFQSQSLALLHIISVIDKEIPIYFLNTGYHFPETLEFKEEVTKQLDLNVIDLSPAVPKHQQRDGDGKLYFTSDPDYCCYLNKIQPMEPVLKAYDVWINGVRADQSNTRKAMQAEEKAQQGVTRFHPMLDWTLKDIFRYIKKYNLPRHPLEDKGYMSIGCQPCTQKLVPDMSATSEQRSGRWAGMKKTECGLHTDLIDK